MKDSNRAYFILICILSAGIALTSLINTEVLAVLTLTCLHAVILILPMMTFMLLAFKMGVKNEVVSFGFGALGSGCLAYLNFWIWLFNPTIGIVFAVGSYLCLAWIFCRYLKADGLRIQALKWWWPTLLWFSYALFILTIGLAPTGAEGVLSSVAQRFTHGLPVDNQIPFIFAKQIASGQVLMPMLGDWHSSDRPPLQTAFLLASGSVRWGDLNYQVHSTLLQCTWLLGLWAVLKQWGMDRFTLTLGLFVTMFSSIAIVHGLFTWPKLLPVFYLLLVKALLMNQEPEMLKQPLIGVLVGGLAGLSMLSHGGSVFALLGIGLALLLSMRLPSASFTFSVILSCLLLMISWTLYQSYLDPPGNRLIKWHLAGIIPIDSRSTMKTLVDSYGALTLQEFFDGRLQNIRTIFGDVYDWSLKTSRTAIGMADTSERIQLRNVQFFVTAANIGVFLLAPLAMILGRKFDRFNARIGLRCLLLALTTSLVWIFLMFIPNSTVIHQGTLLVPLLALLGLSFVAVAFSRGFALLLAGLNFSVVAQLYFYTGLFETSGPIYSYLIAAILVFFLTLTILFKSTEENIHRTQGSHGKGLNF